MRLDALRSVLREPLVHFALAGALLFAVHARVARPPEGRIVVAQQFVDGLIAEHREHTGRAPTDEETKNLVERYVDEEVLYREALALGLDRGDVIVRRRLVQKMELTARARVAEPTESEVADYVAAHREKYLAAEAVSFEHVFVSRDRHGDAAQRKAEELLVALRGGAAPTTLGETFVAGSRFGRRTRGDLQAMFGASFADGALAAKDGEWSGPIASTYGLHLVRVTERFGPGQSPSRDAQSAGAGARPSSPRAREDLLNERREAAVRAEIERLRARYSVVVEGRP